MSTSYTRFNIQDLPLEENPSGTDLLEVAVATGNGYVMKRETAAAIADAIVNDYEYTQDLNTTSKKITGAINEVMSAKADITSLATVATSGAYSDLSGKSTIDTALDTTSTNAVENRAVAGAINSIKSDITVEGSASGDIATFVDGSDNPLRELKISIVAQQSGSGDPSPTNVRPISGWSAVDVTRCAKNLVYKKLANKSIRADGTMENSNDYSLFIAQVKKNAKYTLSVNGTAQSLFLLYGFYLNDPVLGDTTLDSTRYTSGANPHTMEYDGYIAIRLNNIVGDNVQLEYSETATAYESYNGNTYNIDWEDEAGTVYGGTLNVKTGELIVTHLKKLGSECTWGLQDSQNQIYYTPTFNTIKKKGNVNIICDTYKTSNASSVANMDDLAIKGRITDGNIYIRDTNYTLLDNFRAAVANAEIVFELDTPVTYQLTPTEIRSLLGLNNVWADCGAITELKYIRDLNLCINDIIARIEALEGGSNTRSLSVSPVLTKSLTSDSDKTEGKTEETEEETKEEAQNER